MTDSNVLCKETFIWNDVPCDKRGKLLPIGGAAYTCNYTTPLHGRVLSVRELCGRRINDQVQGSSTVQTVLTVSGRLYLLT